MGKGNKRRISWYDTPYDRDGDSLLSYEKSCMF